MTETEREMLRKGSEDKPSQERFTSLQPTYEDSVPPDHEDDWHDHS